MQMAQMMVRMKAMALDLQQVRAQVGKLQQDRNPFPKMPVVPYDDDDEDDDEPAFAHACDQLISFSATAEQHNES